MKFYHLLYFKIQKLVEKYMYYCSCYYLAELSVVTTCNICLWANLYEKTIYRFLTVFTRLKNIFLSERAPCSAGALDPGLAGLCLKTALIIAIHRHEPVIITRGLEMGVGQVLICLRKLGVRILKLCQRMHA